MQEVAHVDEDLNQSQDTDHPQDGQPRQTARSHQEEGNDRQDGCQDEAGLITAQVVKIAIIRAQVIMIVPCVEKS